MILHAMYLYYGALTPGWHTLRAFSSGQRNSLDLWLKYWVIYALLQGLGYLTDFLFEGIMHYKSIKLILSALLWFSSPYSTSSIYTLLVWVIGSRSEDNHEEQRGEPLLNGELLKRELDVLMTEIAGSEADNRDKQTILRNLRMPLESLDRQALQQILTYLGQRHPDQPPEDEQQCESSDDDY